MNSASQPQQAVRFAWRLTTSSYLCLFGLLLVWHLRILPLPADAAISILVPLGLPLLIAGPGLFRGKTYTFQWMSLVVWIWFAHGAMEAWTHKEVPVLAGIASLEALLSISLFVGLVLFLRAQKALREPSEQTSE